MLKKTYLICLTGLDGSGKSTHTKALIKHLKSKGYDCCYVWGASKPLFSYGFFALTKILGYWKKSKPDSYTDPLEYAPKKLAKKLAKLMRLLFFIDFQLKTTVTIRLKMLEGKNVVCDRYFYDLLMDLDVTEKNSSCFSTLLSKTLPLPIIAFLLDAPLDLSKKRRGFSEQELRPKRVTYLKIAEQYYLHRIDASLDYTANQEKIRELTLSAIKKQAA